MSKQQQEASSSKTTLNPYQSFGSIVEKNAKQKYSSTSPFAAEYITYHLGKSKNIDANTLYTTRVKGRQISLDTQNAKTSRLSEALEERKERRENHKARKKLNIIGRKEAALKGLWTLRKDQAKYELFVPLHELWLGYMSELLSLPPRPSDDTIAPVLPNSSTIHPKLVKADFHGSIITVKQSRNPCLVGVSGIVILETENAFRVISKKNQTKLIPKQNSVFSLRVPIHDVRPGQGKDTPEGTTGPTDLDAIPVMEIELYGNQFRFRAEDRANKKFKPKETIEL